MIWFALTAGPRWDVWAIENLMFPLLTASNVVKIRFPLGGAKFISVFSAAETQFGPTLVSFLSCLSTFLLFPYGSIYGLTASKFTLRAIHSCAVSFGRLVFILKQADYRNRNCFWICLNFLDACYLLSLQNWLCLHLSKVKRATL